jgi:hypothetical protein
MIGGSLILGSYVPFDTTSFIGLKKGGGSFFTGVLLEESTALDPSGVIHVPVTIMR